MKADVTAFFDRATNTVSYIVKDPKSHHCVIIDPVLDFDPKRGRTNTHSADQIIDYVKDHRLTVNWILETHAHADHLSAAAYIKETLDGKVAIGEHITGVQKTFKPLFNIETTFKTDGSQFDHLFQDSEEFSIGDLKAQVIYTPGHTAACITYLIGDAAFVGDTLFMPDYGTARCDFPGGDAATLYRSIRKILSLPQTTRLFMCHDYKPPGRSEYVWETTVAEQRAKNIHIHDGISEEKFVEMRTARDKTLDMPVLIIPSIQVNIRAGHFPPTEKNGVCYLKIPIDVF